VTRRVADRLRPAEVQLRHVPPDDDGLRKVVKLLDFDEPTVGQQALERCAGDPEALAADPIHVFVITTARLRRDGVKVGPLFTEGPFPATAPEAPR
jgi:hypothetical protein